MKISTETNTILKNFATINPGILFRKGNVVRTISAQNNIFSQAKIVEKFPQNFAIYDLNNFLSVNSLFKEGSELEFEDKHVIIKSINGRSKIRYRCTEESMIVAAPDKEPGVTTSKVKFTFSKEDFERIMKTAAVLGSPHIAVESDGESTHLYLYNEQDDSAHTNSLELSDVVTEGKNFKLVFKTENLKVIPDTYVVEIYESSVSTWTSTTQELKYWITLETNSKFS